MTRDDRSEEGEPSTRVGLCGKLELQIAGRETSGALPGGLATTLFACLASCTDPLTRAELVEALWPGPASRERHAGLSTLLSRLRRALGPDVLFGRERVELRLPPPVRLDVDVAKGAVEAAREASAAGDWAQLFERTGAALSILERGFLPGLEAPWIDMRRSELEELQLTALELRCRGGLALADRRADGVTAARRMIAIAPYREAGYRLLMLALERDGNVAEALLIYDRLRVLLSEELGTAPALELRVLHEQLLRGAGARAGDRGAPPVAGHRPRTVTGSLVGRRAELGRLEALRNAGTNRLVGIGGEPGIGKSRLAAEFAEHARACGALALHGSCDEETLVPYQPFIEALQDYVTWCPTDRLRRQLAGNGRELSRIIPALRQRLPDLAAPPQSVSETERYWLFTLVAGFLAEIETSVELVVVLDDLHWADHSTLSLLRHVLRARRPGRRPSFVLATYRTTEVEDALSNLLAELQRDDRIELLRLDGLDEGEVGSLMEQRVGAPPPPGLERDLHRHVAGNPFFVEEFLRDLIENGTISRSPQHWGAEIDLASMGVPAGIRHMVGRRLARIPSEVRQVLTIAAVIGARFRLEILERLTDLSDSRLVEVLELAAAAHLITADQMAFGAYAFSHALVRETLLEELTLTRRVLLHRQIGEALAEQYAGSIDLHLAELAHHFHEAAPGGDPERAIDYGERAGRFASGQLAYEEAARHHGRALRALDLVAGASPARRCALLILRGEAERGAANLAYRATLFEAADLAAALDDPEQLARAALANHRGFFSSTFDVDTERATVLERALDAYDPADSTARARLLSQLAVELVPGREWDRRARLSGEALAMARRTGDTDTLALVLSQRFVTLWGPRTLAERRAIADEGMRLAPRVADRALVYQCELAGAHAALEAGEMAEADRYLARASATADQLGQSTLSWFAATARAKRGLISSPPDVAERLAFEAYETGRGAGEHDAQAWLTSQLFVVRFHQGRLGELPPPDSDAGAQRSTMTRLTGAITAVVLSETGRTADARAALEALARDGLADLPHDWATLAIPALAALACAHVADKDLAEALHPLLKPYAEQFVNFGPSWMGATSHYLGLLAGTLGRYDEAETWFAAAAEQHSAVAADAWLARTRLDWAELLVRRRGGLDADSSTLLADGLSSARALGLGTVEHRAARLFG